MPINRKQKVFPNGTLIIENVERNSDQATYTCVAKNAEGYSARGALEVQVMGKFIEVTFIHFLFRHSLKRGFAFLHTKMFNKKEIHTNFETDAKQKTCISSRTEEISIRNFNFLHTKKHQF